VPPFVIMDMEANLMSRFLWPLRLAGAGLLVATAAIHLDLYLTGYSTIHVIGVLFLLQVIAGFALALAVLVTPLVAPSSWLPAAASAALGAGFAVSTLGGYLLSLWVGLFGFREIRTTAGVVAGVIEIAAFAVLALLTVASVPVASDVAEGSAVRAPSTVPAGAGRGPSASGVPVGEAPSLAERAARLRKLALPAVAVVSVAAFAVLGISVANANGGSSSPATAGGVTMLKTASIGGVTVLTDANGRTLYWFAPDKPSKSVCYGDCAAYWPPVTGKPTVAAGVTGVTGTLGTTTRTDGTVQATYNGHPLYTYVGDTGPGAANGNNVNLNGGFWYEVKATG
jgi:predicted lipoprotein with Yx(FWY)xxD motif